MLVMVLIDSDSYRVEAYFEETKIPHVKPGASAEIHLMDGSPALQGTVSSIARGITDQDDPDGMFMSMAPIRILRANEHGVLRRRQLRSPPWVQAGLNVRITPESGRVADIRGRRKSATNGLMHATIDLPSHRDAAILLRFGRSPRSGRTMSGGCCPAKKKECSLRTMNLIDKGATITGE